jgi:hypothetical protein
VSGPTSRLLHLGVLELSTTPDNSSTRLVIETYGPAELPRDQLEQLVDAVLEHLGQTRADAGRLNEAEFMLGEVERQREQERERAETAEAQLREQLAQLEAARTALDIADRRAHGLERDLERMRAAFDPSNSTVQR